MTPTTLALDELLLQVHVALPVARDFVDQATEKAVGQDVIRSVTPGQMVVKIVHDALIEMLGAETAELNLAVTPPAVIMMVGGIVAILIGVDAEGKGLEDIADPLSRVDSGAEGGEPVAVA